MSCSLRSFFGRLCFIEVTEVQESGKAQYAAYLDTTMLGSQNSRKCLTDGTCDPLGGHSVWSALPAFQSTSPDTLPITLVSAQADGTGLFHDDVVVRAASWIETSQLPSS